MKVGDFYFSIDQETKSGVLFTIGEIHPKDDDVYVTPTKIEGMEGEHTQMFKRSEGVIMPEHLGLYVAHLFTRSNAGVALLETLSLCKTGHRLVIDMAKDKYHFTASKDSIVVAESEHENPMIANDLFKGQFVW